MIYSVHPAIAHARAVIDHLPKKTGKSLASWAQLLKKDGPTNDKERRAWLKQQYGLGGTTVTLIVEHAAGQLQNEIDPQTYLRSAEKYVDDLFAGAKAPLRAIYDAIIQIALQLGDDVKICPCKTMIPLYRKHVFAQIKPSTKSRLDLGLFLRGIRSIPSYFTPMPGANASDRITHRVALACVDDLNEEIKTWLLKAYQASG